MECTPNSTGGPLTNNTGVLMGNLSSTKYTNLTSLLIPEDYMTYKNIAAFLNTYIISSICMFGVVGNTLNLVVLTRRSLTTHMDHMEKSVNISLIALAVSDLLFCLCAFPHAIKDKTTFSSPSVDFWLLYTAYGEAVVNSFLLSSTWLTVAMAIMRYLAVYHPLEARLNRGLPCTRVILVCVFLFSVIFNLPRYWMKQISYIDCMEGGRSYYSESGPLRIHVTAEIVYMWIYFVTAIAIPLCVLAYCNIYLIHALHVTRKLRRQYSGSAYTVTNSTNIVTLTLSIIVVFYVILVAPAELLNFGRYMIKSKAKYSLSLTLKYTLAVTIGNTLQTVNFAFNFVLYCIINVHFRKVTRRLFCSVSRFWHRNATPAVRQFEQQPCLGRHDNVCHHGIEKIKMIPMNNGNIHAI